MSFTKDQDEELSLIRHQLKNPLATMKVMIYVIDKKAKKENLSEIEEHLAKLDKKIEDVVELIDKLLSV